MITQAHRRGFPRLNDLGTNFQELAANRIASRLLCRGMVPLAVYVRRCSIAATEAGSAFFQPAELVPNQRNDTF